MFLIKSKVFLLWLVFTLSSCAFLSKITGIWDKALDAQELKGESKQLKNVIELEKLVISLEEEIREYKRLLSECEDEVRELRIRPLFKKKSLVRA